MAQIFRTSGVGSKAWYIQAVKASDGKRSGFSYLRAESSEDGKQLSFDEIKSSVSQLVAAGYLKKHEKPGAPLSTKYEVTSFGHRYLEENKDELEFKGDPQSTAAPGAGVKHDVMEAPAFRPSAPESPTARKQAEKALGGAIPEPPAPDLEDDESEFPGDDGFESRPGGAFDPEHHKRKTDPITPPENGKSGRDIDVPTERPIDRVVDRAVTLGQEIEKYNRDDPEFSTTSKEKLQVVEKPAPATGDIQKPAGVMIMDKPSTPPDLAAQLRLVAGEILVERSADKVTVKDVLERLESHNV